MSIYKEQLPAIANRITGRIETGNVPNSRRKRNFVGQRYAVGRARSGGWQAGRPYPIGKRSTSR